MAVVLLLLLLLLVMVLLLLLRRRRLSDQHEFLVDHNVSHATVVQRTALNVLGRQRYGGSRLWCHDLSTSKRLPLAGRETTHLHRRRWPRLFERQQLVLLMQQREAQFADQQESLNVGSRAFEVGLGQSASKVYADRARSFKSAHGQQLGAVEHDDANQTYQHLA